MITNYENKALSHTVTTSDLASLERAATAAATKLSELQGRLLATTQEIAKMSSESDFVLKRVALGEVVADELSAIQIGLAQRRELVTTISTELAGAIKSRDQAAAAFSEVKERVFAAKRAEIDRRFTPASIDAIKKACELALAVEVLAEIVAEAEKVFGGRRPPGVDVFLSRAPYLILRASENRNLYNLGCEIRDRTESQVPEPILELISAFESREQAFKAHQQMQTGKAIADQKERLAAEERAWFKQFFKPSAKLAALKQA